LHGALGAQNAGPLKVSAAGFNWRKSGGGKEVNVPKEGACVSRRRCP
jgi:hypothetical protein